MHTNAVERSVPCFRNYVTEITALGQLEKTEINNKLCYHSANIFQLGKPKHCVHTHWNSFCAATLWLEKSERLSNHKLPKFLSRFKRARVNRDVFTFRDTLTRQPSGFSVSQPHTYFLLMFMCIYNVLYWRLKLNTNWKAHLMNISQERIKSTWSRSTNPSCFFQSQEMAGGFDKIEQVVATFNKSTEPRETLVIAWRPRRVDPLVDVVFTRSTNSKWGFAVFLRSNSFSLFSALKTVKRTLLKMIYI